MCRVNRPGEFVAPNGRTFTVRYRDDAQAARMNRRSPGGVKFQTGWYYSYCDEGTGSVYHRGTFSTSAVAYEDAMRLLEGPRVTTAAPPPTVAEYALQGFQWPDGTLGKLSAAVNELLADVSARLGGKPQTVDVAGAVFEGDSIRLRLVPRPANSGENE